MIDFLKILIECSETRERLLFDNRLIWVKEIERLGYDGESIYTTIIKEYKGIVFCFYNNKVEVLFKPHYFFNNNLHNADDFRSCDCIKILFWFIDLFKIRASEARVINIEFGLNFLSPIPIEGLITFSTYHGKNIFRNHTGLKYSKVSSYMSSKGKSNKYKVIKFYAKGLQYLDYAERDLARFEIKSKQSKYIMQLGVYNLSDLLRTGVYDLMGEVILKEFKALLILFPESIPDLTSNQQKRLDLLLNPNNWYGFTQQSRNQFSKKRVEYYKLISRKPDNLKRNLIQIVENKINALKMGAYSTPSKLSNLGAYSKI